eukprot:scaffold11579_cov58-Phaeocystis_antarctica.AAC.1
MRKLSAAMRRMLNGPDIQAEARATGDVVQAEDKDGADLVNPTFSAEPVMRGEVEALVEDTVTLRFLPADVSMHSLSKWFGAVEASPEDEEEMFKRFTIDQNKKYGEGAY